MLRNHLLKSVIFFLLALIVFTFVNLLFQQFLESVLDYSLISVAIGIVFWVFYERKKDPTKRRFSSLFKSLGIAFYGTSIALLLIGILGYILVSVA